MKKRAFDAPSNAAMEFVIEEFVFGLHISQSAMLRTQIPHVSCSWHMRARRARMC